MKKTQLSSKYTTLYAISFVCRTPSAEHYVYSGVYNLDAQECSLSESINLLLLIIILLSLSGTAPDAF